MDMALLHDTEQIRCATEPHRMELLRRLMARPATITQLGLAFDRHPAWIRHHVIALMRAGLVELAEERKVRNYTEKIYRASAGAYQIHLLLAPEFGGENPLLILGSDDFAVEALAALSCDKAGHPEVVTVPTGSLDGLIALRQGLADVAGCHLIDSDSGEYNTPYVRHMFPDRPTVIVTLAHREQGMLVAHGNPKGIRHIEDVADPGVRFVNRNKGSGTRVWLDRAFRDLGIDTAQIAGYSTEALTHSALARLVASGDADVGIGVRAAAVAEDVDFIPLFHERFDLVFDAARLEADARFEPLRERIDMRDFRRKVASMAGYDATEVGRETRIAV